MSETQQPAGLVTGELTSGDRVRVTQTDEHGCYAAGETGTVLTLADLEWDAIPVPGIVLVRFDVRRHWHASPRGSLVNVDHLALLPEGPMGAAKAGEHLHDH